MSNHPILPGKTVGCGRSSLYAITTNSSYDIILTEYVTCDIDLNADGDLDVGGEDSTGYSSYDIFVTMFDSDGIP